MFNVGKIQTVLGPICPQTLGVTLAHEHILSDLSVVFKPKDQALSKAFFDQPVNMATLGRIRHFQLPNSDNYHLFDIDDAITEVNLFKQHGGDCIVEATSIGIARDPHGLARVSRATGVKVVMGSSYYVGAAHPPEVELATPEDLTRSIVRDIQEGAQGTDIKAGIIGEVGCSWPLTERERKVLEASARAQQITGAPLLIHPGRGEKAPIEILDILSKSGGDLARTIIGHIDRTVFSKDTLKEIAGTGCYLEWDLFGREESYYFQNPTVDMPGDGTKMNDISWAIAAGYGKKILISHDISSKHRLDKYGGHGYHYISAHIVPRMRTKGYTEQMIDDILVNNPRDVLTLAPRPNF